MLTVITGPPCSGKSTHATQHALPGDVIIDFDRIAQAFGSPVTHGHDKHIWKVTIEARQAAIDAAIECHHQGARVWIVDSKPPARRREFYDRHGARLVELEATADELHRRATAATRPAYVHAAIDQFLAGDAVPFGEPLSHAVTRGGRRATSPSPRPRTRW